MNITGITKIFLNICNTKDSFLCRFGEGHLNPFKLEYPGACILEKIICLNKNIQIINDIRIDNLNEVKIKSIFLDFATKIGNAYGQDEPECFNKRIKELLENWYY